MINYMICQKCKKEFDEKLIEVSHDVPCYLFDGDSRREKKNKADKFGRHNLCKDCHREYELKVLGIISNNFTSEDKEKYRKIIYKYSISWFTHHGDDDDSI